MAKLVRLYDKITISQDIQKDICIKIVDHLVKKVLKKITNDADENILNYNDEIIAKKGEVFDERITKDSYK